MWRPAPHAFISKSKVSPGVILEFHNVAESKLLFRTLHQNNFVCSDIV